jgi:hypothetical protein
MLVSFFFSFFKGKWFALYIKFPREISVLEGIHPVQEHSPPNRFFSTRAVLTPIAPAATEATKPAAPPPITISS